MFCLHVHTDVMENNLDNRIYNLIKVKGPLSQKICNNGFKWFSVIKTQLEEIAKKLQNDFKVSNPEIIIEYKQRGDNQAQLRLADDLILFQIQDNIFRFDDKHPAAKTSYVKSDLLKGHCCIINIYNFLADSFIKKRTDDFGILIARMFINIENHFFVEGKKQTGLLFNDFVNETINEEKTEVLIKNVIIFCMEHDLITPSFDTVQTITVAEISENAFSFLSNSKKLGFDLKSNAETKA